MAAGYYDAYPSDRDTPWYWDEPEPEDDPENELPKPAPAEQPSTEDEVCPI